MERLKDEESGLVFGAGRRLAAGSKVLVPVAVQVVRS